MGDATGLRHGGHVCWTFADAGEFSAAVLAFLDERRRRGEQLLLTGGSEADLLGGPVWLAWWADSPPPDLSELLQVVCEKYARTPPAPVVPPA